MTESTSPPLGKYLASSDKKTRDKAVKHLALFLSNPENNALPEIEIAKLWKGLFYCFWMSDKHRVQQDLAQELAELLLTITSISSSLSFLKGFWITTVREWNRIDRLRMDKYYMLVRRFLNATFRFLIRTKWDPSALQDYTSILTNTGGPLCPTDSTRASWPYLPSGRNIPRGTGKGPVRFRLTRPRSHPRSIVPVHILRCLYTVKYDI
ncbi:nucleolar protein,Nop52-domain-containing protein [Butyriboletus roseoflavus]|nr:nucleolar protein,Nop52-domain-containing protein [Butyriboletus roseoflavus]